MILEICAGTVQSAINAEKGGADRIELCTNLEVDGLTPSRAMIREVRELVNIPIFTLVRPRAGGFVYSEFELEGMKRDIRFCKEAGCEGVVIGTLNEDRTINFLQMKELIYEADGLEITFHRAFDQVLEPLAALKRLSSLGVNRILTSGQAISAIQGLDRLKELVDAAPDDLLIMPGGGIRPENIKELLESGAVEYHSSALMKGGAHSDPVIIKELLELLQ